MFFIKGDLSNFEFDIQSSILPIAGSDHYPIQIVLFEPSKLYRNPFKCEKMWFLDQNFMNLVKNWWIQDNFKGSKMFIFVSKMKSIKEKILRWNKEHFKNIFKEKLDIEEDLCKLNTEVIKNGMNNNTFYLEKDLLAKQQKHLGKRRNFLETKVKREVARRK